MEVLVLEVRKYDIEQWRPEEKIKRLEHFEVRKCKIMLINVVYYVNTV